MLGKVVSSESDLEKVDYYFWKQGYTFLPGDYVNHERAIWECVEGIKSIGCGWIIPGVEFFGFDENNAAIPSPWKKTSKVPGKELDRPIAGNPVECIPWWFSEEFSDDDKIFGYEETIFDKETLKAATEYIPWEGFVTFKKGDHICVEDRVVTCEIDLCNLDPRADAQTWGKVESMFKLTRSPALPKEPKRPRFEKCYFQFSEWTFTPKVGGKFYCDLKDNELQVWRCKEQPFAHLCNTVLPNDADAKLEDIEKAWEAITDFEGLYFKRHQAKDKTPPKEMKCHDWLKVNGHDAETLYSFDYLDYACDEDRVWECMDP